MSSKSPVVRLLSINGAAKALGVSRYWVVYRIADGRDGFPKPHVRIAGASYFRSDDIEAFRRRAEAAKGVNRKPKRTNPDEIELGADALAALRAENAATSKRKASAAETPAAKGKPKAERRA